MDANLSFDVRLSCDFDPAVERVTAELQKEGFGVLTRIDVHSTLKQKLDVTFRPYAILGACNPSLAHKALSSRPDVGLLLPCNVTVEALPEGGTMVRVIDPRGMMEAGGMADDATLAEIGEDAHTRLSRVAAALETEAKAA